MTLREARIQLALGTLIKRISYRYVGWMYTGHGKRITLAPTLDEAWERNQYKSARRTLNNK